LKGYLESLEDDFNISTIDSEIEESNVYKSPHATTQHLEMEGGSYNDPIVKRHECQRRFRHYSDMWWGYFEGAISWHYTNEEETKWEQMV